MSRAKQGGGNATKQVAEAVSREQANFINGLQPGSSKNEVQKLPGLMAQAAERNDTSLLSDGLTAIARVCGSEQGYLTVMSTTALETARGVQLSFPGLDEEVKATIGAIAAQAADFCYAMDHVDFPRLPLLMDVLCRLGGEHPVAALAALSAVERFAWHRIENRIAMMKASVIPAIHRIIAVHRQPELVHEAFVVLFRVTDCPSEALKEFVVDERDLIKTIVETLNMAPLNMRLQLAGLRLLASWAQVDDKRSLKAIRESGAPEALQRVRKDLTSAGMSHAVSWIYAVAGQALGEPRGAAAGD